MWADAFIKSLFWDMKNNQTSTVSVHAHPYWNGTGNAIILVGTFPEMRAASLSKAYAVQSSVFSQDNQICVVSIIAARIVLLVNIWFFRTLLKQYLIKIAFDFKYVLGPRSQNWDKRPISNLQHFIGWNRNNFTFQPIRWFRLETGLSY